MGFLTIRADISKFVKDLGAITTGPDSIYQAGGRALRDMLYEEFKALVRETPQFSGSTAASWQIGFPEDLDGEGYHPLPKPAQGVEAARIGDEYACSISIGKAYYTLFDTDPSRYFRANIVLINNAPGYDTAMEGPLRHENMPPEPGALDRFMARVEAKVIEPDFKDLR